MNNVTLQILSTLLALGLGFIFIGMPIWGIVAWFQRRKRRLAEPQLMQAHSKEHPC